jgi:environmental stress-induced protein Ves
MIEIIPSQTFKTIPWKNGKGKTTELAINSGATLDNFQWRLSIANVVEDGIFSDFSGYTRNLVLIKGKSIHLTHDDIKTDKLTRLLDFATFDGGCKTLGTLQSGEIKDFNIITSTTKFSTIVNTYSEQILKSISFNGLVFAYSLSDDMKITDSKNNQKQIKKGDLLQLHNPKDIKLQAENFILIFMSSIK